MGISPLNTAVSCNTDSLDQTALPDIKLASGLGAVTLQKGHLPLTANLNKLLPVVDNGMAKFDNTNVWVRSLQTPQLTPRSESSHLNPSLSISSNQMLPSTTTALSHVQQTYTTSPLSLPAGVLMTPPRFPLLTQIAGSNKVAWSPSLLGFKPQASTMQRIEQGLLQAGITPQALRALDAGVLQVLLNQIGGVAKELETPGSPVNAQNVNAVLRLLYAQSQRAPITQPTQQTALSPAVVVLPLQQTRLDRSGFDQTVQLHRNTHSELQRDYQAQLNRWYSSAEAFNPTLARNWLQALSARLSLEQSRAPWEAAQAFFQQNPQFEGTLPGSDGQQYARYEVARQVAADRARIAAADAAVLSAEQALQPVMQPSQQHASESAQSVSNSAASQPAPTDETQAIHVYKRVVLQVQRMVGGVTEQDFRKLLADADRSLPAEQYAKVVAALVQFGNLQSLDGLLQHAAFSRQRILTTSEHDFGNSLRYFQQRNMLDRDAARPVFYAGTINRLAGKSGFLVVDELFLQKLESDPRIRDALARSKVTYLLPKGMDIGYSIFRPLTPTDLRVRADAVAREVVALMKREPGLSFDQALHSALSAPTQNRLRQLGLLAPDGSNFVAIDALPRSAQVNARTLSQSTQSQSFNLVDLAVILAQVPQTHRESAAHALMNDLNVLSPEVIAQKARQAYRNIQVAVAQAGGDPNDIRVVVPSPVKSYSALAQTFAAVNNVSGNRVIPLHLLGTVPKTATVVMIDDMIGSGQSFIEVLKKARSSFQFQGLIFTTALLTSTQGQANLKNYAATDSRYSHVAVDLVTPPKQTFSYQSLSAEQRALLEPFYLGGYRNRGQGGLGIHSALTGAPDNNSIFFRHPHLVELLSNGNLKQLDSGFHKWIFEGLEDPPNAAPIVVPPPAAQP